MIPQIRTALEDTHREISFWLKRGLQCEIVQLIPLALIEYHILYEELNFLDHEMTQDYPDVEDLMMELRIHPPFKLSLHRYLTLSEKIDWNQSISTLRNNEEMDPNFAAFMAHQMEQMNKKDKRGKDEDNDPSSPDRGED